MTDTELTLTKTLAVSDSLDSLVYSRNTMIPLGMDFVSQQDLYSVLNSELSFSEILQPIFNFICIKNLGIEQIGIRSFYDSYSLNLYFNNDLNMNWAKSHTLSLDKKLALVEHTYPFFNFLLTKILDVKPKKINFIDSIMVSIFCDILSSSAFSYTVYDVDSLGLIFNANFNYILELLKVLELKEDAEISPLWHSILKCLVTTMRAESIRTKIENLCRI